MADFHAISTIQITLIEFITWVLPHKNANLFGTGVSNIGWGNEPIFHQSLLRCASLRLENETNLRIGRVLSLGKANDYKWHIGAAFCAFPNVKSAFTFCTLESTVLWCGYHITVQELKSIRISKRGPRWSDATVYPKKYAHGFVVLCFVVVMQSFIMNSHEVFIHIHQGCFAGTGAIVRLPQCQWSKPDGYGKISQCITTTKHSKAKTVCIFLGIYCSFMTCMFDNPSGI